MAHQSGRQMTASTPICLQELHLWNGSLASSFTLAAGADGSSGGQVTVDSAGERQHFEKAGGGACVPRRTDPQESGADRCVRCIAVHPTLDLLAVRLCSDLVASGALGLGIGFPYPTTSFSGGTDWRLPDRHSSAIVDPPDGEAADPWGCPGAPMVLNHTMDNTTYFVHVGLESTRGTAGRPATQSKAACPMLRRGSVAHDWVVTPASQPAPRCLEATFRFTKDVLQLPASLSVAEVFAASASAWAAAWQVKLKFGQFTIPNPAWRWRL